MKKYYLWTAIFLATTILTVGLWRLLADDGSWQMTALDIGQGDAILLTVPSGQHILVDTGRPDDKVIQQLGEALPYFNRRLDLVLITHYDADHVGGLPAVLDRYPVGQLIVSAKICGTDICQAWRQVAVRRKISVIVADQPRQVDWHGCQLLIYPAVPATGNGNWNESGLVSKVTCGHRSVLLTADIGMATEQNLLASGQDWSADILKVAHHGSVYSSSLAFLQAVHPSWAVISVGKFNNFGHPSARVLDRLQRLGIKTQRTDRDGRVSLKISDSGISLASPPFWFFRWLGL